MKMCPVCESAVFDDMDVCFGCMHSFESEDASEVKTKEDATEVDGVLNENLVLRVELKEPGESRSWTFELSR